MKIYLGLLILFFTYSCSTTAIALINPEKEDSRLVEGQIKFIKKRSKKGVYMIANLKSEKLNSISIYIGNKNEKNFQERGSFYGENSIKINFEKPGKAIYGLLTENWCLECEDFHKNILGKHVFILDQDTKLVKVSELIRLK